MTYGVEELSRRAGVSIDTIRFYQAQGLLDRPQRVGRRAAYGEDHLERLRKIRELKEQGLTLAGIKRVVGPETGRLDAALIGALTEGRGVRRFDRAGLARETGVPEALIEAVEKSGFVEPLREAGEAAYDESDVELARAALAILEQGLPLNELFALATDHAAHVRDVADRAANLFDDHVRHQDGAEVDPEKVVDAFRKLLPAVTSLVAHHFQRTLVARALERLEKKGDSVGLEQALEASQSSRLAIRWS